MARYTARSMTHSLQSVIASTEAARGALYSSASSPKPLRRASSAVRAHARRMALDLDVATVEQAIQSQNMS